MPIRLAVAAALSFATLSPAFAAGVTMPLACRATLKMPLPDGWMHEFRTEPGVAPTLRVASKTPGDALMLVTPLCTADVEPTFPPADEIRRIVTTMSEQAKASAVEQSLPVRELKGAAVEGFYFSATDRAPKPDEFKYLTSGSALVSGLQVTFTILGNRDRAATDAALLGALRDAVIVPVGSATE